MLLCRCSGNLPDLLKPAIKGFLFDSACVSLLGRWFPVTPRLPLHQDEFHVVLDDGIRLVGLPKELRSVFDLVGSIGDLMPDDRIQIVESNPAADDADVGVEWKDEVATEVPPRDADVANHANESSAGNKYAVDMLPDLLQLGQKCLIVLNVSQLVWVHIIAFQVPVRRGCHHEMNGGIVEECKLSCIAVYESMNGRFHDFGQRRPHVLRVSL